MSVNSKMTAIADEIRTLSGETGTMGLDEMASNVAAANTEVNSQVDLIAQITSALEGKAAGGGGGSTVVDDVSKALIERTITEISDDSVETIGENAFRDCYSLATISFPEAKTIGGFAFAYCSKLTIVSFPAVEIIGNGAFYSCTSLATVSLPAAMRIYQHAFHYCSSLTTASFPAVMDIDNYAFQFCTSLTTASFPAATTIGSYAFDNCTNLTTVSFPAATSIDEYAFYSCSALTTASFPEIMDIHSGAFENCHALSRLIIGGAPSICTLHHSDAFGNTPFAGYFNVFSGTPFIYVPASLLTKYQSATNWVYFSQYMVGDESLDVGVGSTVIYIQGNEYIIENGMTWETFVSSTYNDITLTLAPAWDGGDDCVVNEYGDYLRSMETGLPVRKTELIVAGEYDF